MLPHPIKLLFYLVVAALEVTLLHLGVTLLAAAFDTFVGVNRTVLLLVCLVGAWATTRFEGVDADRPWIDRRTMFVCAFTTLYAVKIQLGGGWAPWRGWLLLWPFGGEFSIGLLALSGLLSLHLWVWWRGMELVDYDHSAVLRVLQNGMLVLVLQTIVITPLTRINLGAPPWGPLIAVDAVLIVGLGLLSLSLARVANDLEAYGSQGAWHWLRSGAVSAALIVAGGTLVLSLFSNIATLIVRAVFFVLVAVTAVVMIPLAELVTRFMRRFANPVAVPPAPSASPSPAGSIEPNAAISSFETIVYILVRNFLIALLVLVPLLLMILLIVLVQRRRRTGDASDGAQHESLWSWSAFGTDLLGLLQGLRPAHRGPSLRDALGRLRSDDPAQRIRRRYVQALLIGEAATRTRAPHQTPLEYEPALTTLVPSAAAELQTLTSLYDRARYAAETVNATDAAAAAAAWHTIESQPSKESP